MKRAIAIILAIVGAMLPALVFAIDDPDTQVIVAAYGYGGVLETGDILLIIHYNVDYTSCCPANDASEALVGRYLDGMTAERSAAPYVFVQSGYDQGVISVYFSATDASAAGLTHGDADSAELLGNPSLFPSPWKVTSLITWRTLGSQQALEDDVISIGNALELRADWSAKNLVSTVAGETKLTSGDGEEYFTNSIANLRLMAPNIFTSSIDAPDFIESTFTQSYETDLENQLTGTRFENTFSNIAARHGLAENMVKVLVVGGLALGFAAMVGFGSKSILGMEAEKATLLSGLTIVLTLGFAAAEGMFPFQIIAIMGFLGLFVIGFVFLGLRAS